MNAVERFHQSMAIDYYKWHDGVGYDLEAIDAMNEEEKGKALHLILEKGVTDWRDLEALDRIGTPSAIAAILAVRASHDPDMRLRAHGYGPSPEASEREDAIVQGLAIEDIYAGLSHALEEARTYPSPRVFEALVRAVRDNPGAPAYNAAATLYYLKGKIDSPYSFENREFLLTFSGPDSEVRRTAFKQMLAELELDAPS